MVSPGSTLRSIIDSLAIGLLQLREHLLNMLIVAEVTILEAESYWQLFP